MSPERFAQITAAYGASPARWPQAERAAAKALLAGAERSFESDEGSGGESASGAEEAGGGAEGKRSATAHRARAMLAAAHALDLELSAYAVAEPDDALIRKVLESMPFAVPTQSANASTAPEASEWSPEPSAPLRPSRPKPSKPYAWRHPRLWFSGVGLIGAGAVGVAAGALTMSLLTPAFSTSSSEPTAVEQTYGGTVFSDAGTDGEDQ